MSFGFVMSGETLQELVKTMQGRFVPDVSLSFKDFRSTVLVELFDESLRSVTSVLSDNPPVWSATFRKTTPRTSMTHWSRAPRAMGGWA